MHPVLHRTFETPSGHRLAYGDYGDPNGELLVFFHGSPGSRLEAARLDDVATSMGIRLVAPERSGIGRSELDPRATMLSHARTVLRLVDRLGFERFAVAGYSGGGVLVYAMRHAAPERVRLAVDLAGWAPVADFPSLRSAMAPLDRFYFRVAGSTRWAFDLTFRAVVRAAKNPDPNRLAAFTRSSMSPADRAWLEDRKNLEWFHADVFESCRQGHKGPALDAFNMYRPWGFDPRAGGGEILIFHGEQDRFAPFSFARWKVANIPGCSLQSFPALGHLGLVDEFPGALRAIKDRS